MFGQPRVLEFPAFSQALFRQSSARIQEPGESRTAAFKVKPSVVLGEVSKWDRLQRQLQTKVLRYY